MNGSAFLLVVVGLLLFYVVITDKFYCLEGCFSCLVFGSGQDAAPAGVAAPTSGGVSAPGMIPIFPAYGGLPGVQNQVRGMIGI